MGETAKLGADNLIFESSTTKKYDIPLSHLDYEYVKKCTNVKEIEKILRVLRSGDEGHFPDLERFCEEKIASLNPNSRVLRKDKPIMRTSDIDKDERQQIQEELEGWHRDMKTTEEMSGQTDVFANKEESHIVKSCDDDDDEADLPPVRSCNATLNMQGKQESTKIQPEVSNKRVKPREYREWDKIDIDKELENVDKQEEKKSTTKVSTKPTNIQDHIDTKGMTDEEKQLKANREKDKGNEAFRAGDHEEAIVYYSRSISLLPTAASYNNRALSYLKVSKWDNALKDCDVVLKLEPDNIKALLRRGSAYKGKKEFSKAQVDLERVMELEPNNKRAKDLLEELTEATKKAKKEKKERKEKGRRMVIEEVEGDTDEEEEDCQSIEVEQDKSSEKLDNRKSEGEKTIKIDEDRQQVNLSDKSLVNGNISKNDSNTTEIIQNEKSDILQSGLQKLVKNCENEGQSHQEMKNKSDDKLSNQGDKNVQSLDTNSSNVISENEQIENNQNIGMTQSEEKNSVLEVKENKQNEQIEEKSKSSDGQNEEKISSESVEGKDSEALSLRRPIFIQKKLPENISVLREEGNNLFRTGQYCEAVKKYSTAIDKLQKSKADQVVNLSLIHSNRAACYLKTGDCPAAIKDCTTALDLVPHSVKPLLRRASAYEHIERYRLAYVDYKHVQHIDRSADMAHQGSSRCQSHLQQNDGPTWREKLPPITSVMPWEIPEIVDENDPTSKSTPITIGASSAQPAEPKQVPKEPEQPKQEQRQPEPLKQQRESEPPKKQSQSELTTEEQFDLKKGEGNKCVQQGDFRKAVSLYSECVKLFPDRTVSYTNRALCYLRLNQPTEAEVDCTKALGLEPENVKALFRRGQAKKMLKRYKESLEDLTHLIKVDPKNTAAKKELDLVKNYYREELNSLKKQMPNKPESVKAQPEKQKTNPGTEKKQRKRMVIQEVDSDSEEEKVGKKDKTAVNSKDTPEKIPKTTEKSHSANNSEKPPNKTTQNKGSKKQHSTGSAKTVKTMGNGLPVAPPTVPKLDKATPYEFIQAWNSLKLAKDVQPYADLLKQIQPEDIPTVISNKLDGQMLNTITKCVAEKFVPEGDIDTGYKILHNLCKVPRFQTIAMFLSNADKKDIQTVFKKLQTTKSDCYNDADLIKLKKEYGIK